MDGFYFDPSYQGRKARLMIHIVIVDDEADTHLLYKLKFKKMFPESDQLNLISFSNGFDCLEYLKQNPTPTVDLIMTDINMPEMDGFELLGKVHKQFPHIPVYMISAYESSDFRNKAEQMGAAQFLSKPVDFSRLFNCIQSEIK